MPIKVLTRKLKKLPQSTAEDGIYERVVRGFLNIKNTQVYKRIGKFIIGEKMLDVGTGVGGIALFMKNKGFDVTSIDIDDSSLIVGFPSQLYDGINMPFGDQTFDTAIIIHVLHHCSDNIGVLKEAKRVAKRVIFIEDTYTSPLERRIVSWFDQVDNNEFYEHDYKTPVEWDQIIKNHGWKTIHKEVYLELTYGFSYGRNALYVIE